ncbi:MAG: sulfatase-like hydrolase/transferase [Nitrospirae bacterium]|nr:sulfatase-like hydrolase/transferase [Nitrospirota bacterium]
MAINQAFLFVIRIIFVLSSIDFVLRAANSWGSLYSYFMRFTDLLPELSLAFILWTAIGMFLAMVFWSLILCLYKALLKTFKSVCVEHVILWAIFLVVVIEKTFFNHARPDDISMRMVFLISGGLAAGVVVWLARKYAGRLLSGLNNGISLLAWLFLFLLAAAVPLSAYSLLQKKPPAEAAMSGNISVDEKKPNIILITWDSFTAEDMQLYGYERPTTPFISEWAKNAVVFNRAYSASNLTTQATMSIHTGQRVWTHGVWYYAYNFPPKNHLRNFPALLKESGYDTSAFVQTVYAHPDILGVSDSYKVKDDPRTLVLSPYADVWGVNRIMGFIGRRPIVSRFMKDYSFVDIEIDIEESLIGFSEFITAGKGKGADHFDRETETSFPPDIVYSRFLEYISERQAADKRPFFSWLHLDAPHNPYLPSGEYKGLLGEGDRFNTLKKQSDGLTFHTDYNLNNQPEIDLLRRRYDEFIMYADDRFKAFLSRLSDAVDMSNTIIIFTADHGESFEHGHLGHGGTHLYEPLVHIPMVIKLSDAGYGRRIDMPVEQTDIAPTILQLAGISIPEWMEGRSLVPLLEGDAAEERPVFSMQFLNNRSLGNPITKGTVAVWDRQYKLVHYLEDGRSLLFDLAADPDEEKNIFDEAPDTGRRLLKLIKDNLAAANERISGPY